MLVVGGAHPVAGVDISWHERRANLHWRKIIRDPHF